MEIDTVLKKKTNKICIRDDLAKKNMMFSQESCQAIIEMGNAELIELKKSRVQCSSCLHHVFEGTSVRKWCAASCYQEGNDRTFANIWDRWQNDLEYRKTQKKPLVGTMRLYDMPPTSYRLISLMKRLLNNVVYLRGIEENHEMNIVQYIFQRKIESHWMTNSILKIVSTWSG